ncbi:MAG: SDR family oxidoreductase [Clostridia bacterium]|nr:SDR family oxidoreductase [Clostridia bacterium]
MKRFENQAALITGASVGIGRATAHRLAEQGAQLALVDFNEETLMRLKEELSPYGDSILYFVGDVSDENRTRAIVAEAERIFGKIDILVNNAALWRDASLFMETDTSLWRRYLEINVMGTVYYTQAVLGGMVARGYGRIVNVASVAGVYGNRKMVHYSATKGAVISMTKALAKEVADKGVTVNAVSPGTVSPAAQADMDYVQSSEVNFTGRTGSGRENADLICFLASREAGYINGQNIQIDGCRRML